MFEVDIPAFCPDWLKHSQAAPGALAQYVVDELRRLDADSAPMLRAVLTHPDDRMQTLALAALDPAFLAEDGAPAVQARLWFLKLADGAVPPRVDPQGRPLPAELQGKVLRAKVGNIGGNNGGNTPQLADARKCAGVSGDNRVKVAYSRGNLYLTADVGAAAKPFPLSQAVTILRQWGAGVTAKAYRSAKRSSVRADQEAAEHGQCTWLVVESGPEAPAQRRKSGQD